MWSYKGKSVFVIGILFSLLVFLTVTGVSLIESAAAAAREELNLFFPGELIVRDPRTPVPESVVTGDETGRMYPLADAAAIAELIRRERGVRAVFPFSLGRVLLRADLPGLEPLAAMTAVGVYSNDGTAFPSGLDTDRSGNLPPEAPWILLPSRWAGDRFIPSVDVLFLDRRDADDNFNLTSVTVEGTYSPRGDRPAFFFSAVCFVDMVSLFRSTWRSYSDFSPEEPAKTAAAPFAASSPKISMRGAGNPLSYPYLFSLPAAGRPATDAAPAAVPHYFLISLTANGAPSPAALCEALNRVFSRRDSPARAGVRGREGTVKQAGSRLFVLSLIVGIAFSMILVSANLFLKPVPADAMVRRMLADPDAPVPLRGSFLKKNLFFSVTFGVIGIIPALVMIILYNQLAGESEKLLVSSFLSLPAFLVRPSPTSLAFSGVMMLVFVVAALPGPGGRLKRFIALLRADAKKG